MLLPGCGGREPRLVLVDELCGRGWGVRGDCDTGKGLLGGAADRGGVGKAEVVFLGTCPPQEHHLLRQPAGTAARAGAEAGRAQN